MKKLVMILLVMFFSLLATSSLYAKDDKKIDINFVYNNYTVVIDSDYKISKAIVEQAYVENNKKISILKTYEVHDNSFIIDSNIYAFKIWQVSIKENLDYLYFTDGKNFYGSLEGVERQNISEIKTIKSQYVDTNILFNKTFTNKFSFPSDSDIFIRYFEFYFQFDKDIESLISIDVEYVLGYEAWDLSLYDKKNVYEKINMHDGVELKGFYPIYDDNKLPPLDNPIGHENKVMSITGLEKNFATSVPANYICRVFPYKKADELNKNSKYNVENFAIIKIKYIVDGNFYEDDVINNPTTPDKPLPTLPDPNNFFDWLSNLIEKINHFFNSYSRIIMIILISFISLLLISILYVPISFIFKVIALVFKILFFPITLLFSSKDKSNKNPPNIYKNNIYKDINGKKYYIKK